MESAAAAPPQAEETAIAAAPAFSSAAPTVASVLGLQRRAGNRAVAGMLARQGIDHDPLDAGTKPPPANAGTLKIEEYDVPVGQAAQQHAMEELLKVKGRDGPREFLKGARLAVDRATPIAGVPDNQEHLDKVKQALDELEPIVTKLEEEYDQLLLQFEAAAREVLESMLDESKKRTEAEAFRYGLTMEDITEKVGDSSGEHEVTTTRYDMTEGSQAKAGIAEAAQQLLKRKAEMRPLEERVAKVDRDYDLAKLGARGAYEVPKPAGYDEAHKELDTEKLRYEGLIAELGAQYPALDAVAHDNPSGLEALAKGNAKEAAAVIGPVIRERRGKIQYVLDNKDAVNIYKLPKVVALTKGKQKIDEGSWKDALVERKQQEDLKRDELIDAALAAINLALILLAPVTGGATMVVAAGISSVTAVQHAQSYMLEDAMNKSDLEKAKALSQTEPSLLWLAIEVVAALADVHQAGQLIAAYRPVESAVKAARGAAAKEEIEAARSRVKQACEEAGGGEKLAKRVLDGLEHDAGLASKELGAVESAASKAADKELKGAVTAATERGHVHVSERGVVFSCESPCLEMRNKYATELTDPAYKERLTELEKIESDWANLPKKASAADKKALAVRAAALDDKLAKQILRSKALKLKEALPAIHPVFKEHELTVEAVERIIAKKEVSHVKGQLLEELVGADITKQLKSPDSAMSKLAGLKEGETATFISGDRIRDSEGWLTDGMIVVEREGGYDIRVIVETKAGAASAVELKGVKESLDKLYPLSLDQLNPAGLRAAAGGRIDNLTPKQIDALIEELSELRGEGIEALRGTNPEKFKGLSSAEIDKQFTGAVTTQVKKLPKTREGQLLHDTERIAAAESATRGVAPTEGGDWRGLTIDGKPVNILNQGRPKVVAGLPAGMEEESFMKRIGSAPDPKDPTKRKGDLLDVTVTHGPLTSEELGQVAQDISTRVTAPAP